MTTHQTNLRAFTLIELLVAISLLGIFMLLAAQLFKGALDTAVGAQEAANRIGQWQAVLDTLRTDAWRGQGFVVSEPGPVPGAVPGSGSGVAVISQADQRMVTWRIDDDQLTRIVTRNGEQLGHHTWPDLADGMTFTTGGAVLTLHIDRNTGRGGGRFDLPSQVQLIRRIAP